MKPCKVNGIAVDGQLKSTPDRSYPALWFAKSRRAVVAVGGHDPALLAGLGNRQLRGAFGTLGECHDLLADGLASAGDSALRTDADRRSHQTVRDSRQPTGGGSSENFPADGVGLAGTDHGRENVDVVTKVKTRPRISAG